MATKLISGNEAVALGALRAGVRVVTGYPGTPATGALAALLDMDLPGRHVEWSVNEKVALEVAAGAAWSGQRALCTMKMSGLNVAYDSLCSIAYSGTTGSLVVCVADDPGAGAGMVEQDSRGFAMMSDLPMLEPASVAETYRLTQVAFDLSERCGAPVFVRLVTGIAHSYAPVEVEEAQPPAERPPVLCRDTARYTKAGAAISQAQHRDAIARLAAAGQNIAQLRLNDLYLAPKELRARVPSGAVIEEPGEEPQASGRLEILRQVQDLMSQVQQYLPGPVQEVLLQAYDMLREVHQQPVRQTQEILRHVHDVLIQAQDALGQAQEARPRTQQTLHRAQELVRLAQQALPQTQVATPPPVEEEPPAVTGDQVPDTAQHPLSREGLGIIASGVAASYLEEGIAVIARLEPAHWQDFGPDSVSVLRIRAVNPFPAVEVQALLRHCNTIVVLEELEPHIERLVYIEARRLDFDGRIVGKLEGIYSRVGEYGVSQVVRGIASALDLSLPEGLLQGSTEAAELAAARPITVCAGCPHRGTYLAINQALRKQGYKPDEVMVTGDIGCTTLGVGMNPPVNTVWNEVSMGASISVAQGYVHGGVQTPVIATIGDSTFFHAGLAGLINAVQHQVPLTLIIMDSGWTAMTGMQTNPGTEAGCQGTGERRVDIARIIPALGVEHFFQIDPFDLAVSSETIQRALVLPGVKMILARQECAIQAMRRGLRAGAVRVLPEQCNGCKLCISVTGCPALTLKGDTAVIDSALCYGCGLCADICSQAAIVKEAIP